MTRDDYGRIAYITAEMATRDLNAAIKSPPVSWESCPELSKEVWRRVGERLATEGACAAAEALLQDDPGSGEWTLPPAPSKDDPPLDPMATQPIRRREPPVEPGGAREWLLDLTKQTNPVGTVLIEGGLPDRYGNRPFRALVPVWSLSALLAGVVRQGDDPL